MGIGDCFYLSFDLKQVFHVIVANSLLFSTHIYEKYINNTLNLSRFTLKSIIFVVVCRNRLLFLRKCCFEPVSFGLSILKSQLY